MDGTAFSFFDTAIGACAIAWTRAGVRMLQLPEADEAQGRKRLLRRLPQAREARPDPNVRTAMDGVRRLTAEGRADLSAIALDLSACDEFQRAVYAVARTIPAGETRTYGEVAGRLGDPRAARDVGQALGRNPVAVIVPCHRVLAAGGRPGGFSAYGGVATKLKLLSIERAVAGDAPTLFDVWR